MYTHSTHMCSHHRERSKFRVTSNIQLLPTLIYTAITEGLNKGSYLLMLRYSFLERDFKEAICKSSLQSNKVSLKKQQVIFP